MVIKTFADVARFTLTKDVDYPIPPQIGMFIGGGDDGYYTIREIYLDITTGEMEVHIKPAYIAGRAEEVVQYLETMGWKRYSQ